MRTSSLTNRCSRDSADTFHWTDKPGLVEHYASLLIEGGVRSLLYQSTFGSANILVAKRDVGKARRLLMKA